MLRHYTGGAHFITRVLTAIRAFVVRVRLHV